MENTAIEEFIEYFKNTANVTFTGDKVLDYSISELYYLQTLKFMRELQAKHEEEKKRVVIISYFDGFIKAQDCAIEMVETRNASKMHLTEVEAIQYYEANFKTKEL
jgi:hypothetical protein